MSEDEVTLSNCVAYSNKPTINELIADLEEATVRCNEKPGYRNQLVAARAALRAAVAERDAEIKRLDRKSVV